MIKNEKNRLGYRDQQHGALIVNVDCAVVNVSSQILESMASADKTLTQLFASFAAQI
jgi:hypothetical protein